MPATRRYIRRSRKQWTELVELQSGSGLSVPRFCEQSGVSYQSFMNWRKKLSAQTDSLETPSPFIELTAPGASVATSQVDADSRWLIELDLGDGLQLRIARR